MQTKLGLACWVGCLMMSSSALLVVGCGDDSEQPSGESSGGGDAAGGASSSAPRGGTQAADGGAGPSKGGTSSTGARPNVDPGGPDIPPGPDQPGAGGSEDGGADSPDFDGVDLESVSASPPSGCEGGFDPELGALTLVVGGDAPVVRVSVHAGVVQANGVDCGSASGEKALADAVTELRILGGERDDTVFLDLSDESFEGCLSGEGRILVSLGEGSDSFALLGTLGKDSFQLGSDGDALLVDVSGDGRADVSIEGTPAVVLSTGAEQDTVRADGVALGVAPAARPLTVYGGGNRDSLVGGAADDLLLGGIGNDWFDAGAEKAGGDTFDGGEGSDTVDFSARTAPLTLTLGAGNDDGEADERADVKDSVEIVYGGQAKNEISGGDNDNILWGGPDDDVLAGGKGNDWLNGGASDDQLSGDEGSDALYGDEGDDVLLGGAGDDNLDDDNEGKNTLDGGPGDGDICPLSVKSTNCEL